MQKYLHGIGRNAVTSTVGTSKEGGGGGAGGGGGGDARTVILFYYFVYKFDKNTTSTKSLKVLPPISSEKE